MSITTATFGAVPTPATAGEHEDTARVRKRLPLIDVYLNEQQSLTAVARFAQLHERDALPARARQYRALLPLERPTSGQQYAFSVDLDRCTGCKACVTACHSLNGLGEGETWRSVGLLHGGSPELPLQQAVTTTCHHCIEPACLSGCPANAYEKDAVTGIVRHLDDQCIGCQYCTLTCPYGVPQFNPQLGIVRKCDMCSDRLAAEEAPACVQACPNESIVIRLVDKVQVVEDVQADVFLPGAPSPSITQPTTLYETTRVFPKNMLPADFYNLRPARNHFPLVVLLVLTQLSVGAFSIDYLVAAFFWCEPAIQRYHSLFALGSGLLALSVSVMHLGRPQFGFRALLGIRHSWMSREVAAFGAFLWLALAHVASAWSSPLLALVGLPEMAPAALSALQSWLGAAVALSGLAAIACSVMLYAVTRRTFWRVSLTGPRFFATALVLGISFSLLAFVAAAALGSAVPGDVVAGLNGATIAVTSLELMHELSILSQLGSRQSSDLKRTARLLRGELGRLALVRLSLGTVGGIALPSWQSSIIDPGAALLEPGSLPLIIAALSALCLVAGALVERSLFFMAEASPKMPGAVGQ